MAKRIHRSVPATENHVIQGWEVANATARTALVPVAGDVGRVARQADDGSHWLCTGYAPVTWRRVDQSLDLADQPIRTTAMRMAHAPLEIPGALQTLSGGLFTVLRNRQLLDDRSAEFIRPSNYNSWYISDYLYMMGPYPGYFTAAKVRACVDHFAGSYTNHYVAYQKSISGTWAYITSGGAIPDFHNASTLSLLTALAIERGDTTIWAAHGAMLTDCLDSMARDGSGLLYSNPAAWHIGFPFHDPLKFTGGMGAASAYAAYAYQRLAVLADSALQVKANALIAGLRTLRRSDGYYNASSDQTTPDTICTALVAGFGLGTEAECIASGNALADDYRDGLITQWGGLRFTPKPNDWSAYLKTPGSLLPGQAQNGGYMPGPWVWWVAKAMITAGRSVEARNLMTDVVEWHLRGSTSYSPTDNGLPIEAWNEEIGSIAYDQYPAGVGSFEGLAVPGGPTPDVVVELSGSASAAKVVPVPFHSTSDMEILNPASSTVTVAVSAAGRLYNNGWKERVHGGYLTEKEMGRISLAGETARRSRFGLKPAYPYGGYLKAAITSGTTTQPITLRLKQGEERKPRLLLPPQTWTDAFGGTEVDSRYIRGTKGFWDISGGQLRCTRVYNDEYCLAPMAFADGYIQADITSIWVNHFPGLILRWKDRANFIWVLMSAGATCGVYQVLNGATTLLGSVTPVPASAANVPTTVKLTVVGTQVTVQAGSATAGPWTTGVTGKGLAGMRAESTIPGSLNIAQWDNLSIVPQATAQRDWITDSETIYTRTGTWSKSGATMLTVDTLAFQAAIHPDFSLQQLGATATFNSANWSAKKAGLGLRAASGTNMLYAILDGTTVKIYDRNTTDTLVASFTLATPLTNGVDATMTFRVLNNGTLVVKVNAEYFYAIGGRAVAGSASMVVTTSSASAAQVTFKSMRIEDYTANALQPVPVGYALTAGPGRWHSWTTDMVHAGNLGALVELRDHRGFVVDSQVDGDDVQVAY